jgi:hypothetical protein
LLQFEMGTTSNAIDGAFSYANTAALTHSAVPCFLMVQISFVKTQRVKKAPAFPVPVPVPHAQRRRMGSSP